ncbi:MAG: response regulator transcription factor [Herpetosiphon sp.]
MQHILIIDDEPAIIQVVRQRLERDGFAVQSAPDGETALTLVHEQEFDAVLLDVRLPGMDGFEVLRRIRVENGDLPLIMLTARTDEIDRVVGLELGADDYVVKPFSPRELVARLRSLLRRTAEVRSYRAAQAAATNNAALQIDEAQHTASYRGHVVDLRPREFDLLALLVKHPHQIWSREALLRRVWGGDQNIDSRTVDVHVRRLRVKLSAIDSTQDPIQTQWGVGYRYIPMTDSEQPPGQ